MVAQKDGRGKCRRRRGLIRIIYNPAIREVNFKIANGAMSKNESHSSATSESLEWSSAYCLAALSNSQRETYEQHLATCPSCRELVQRDAALLAKWALATMAEIPAAADERFRERLQYLPPEKQTSGVLLQQKGLLIARSEAMEWQPAGVGIWTKPLFVDPNRQYATSLVRMDKGIHYPAHRHEDVEELYLLAGDLLVEGHSMGAGDYCRAEPDSIHHESSTVGGCLFMLMSSQKDEVLG